jgi:hypothetical protein
MQFRTTGIMLLGAMILPAPCVAQTTPAQSAITRTVVAATKLPNLTAAPLHFKAVSFTLLDIPLLLAYALSFGAVVLVIEAVLVQPFEVKLSRWRPRAA